MSTSSAHSSTSTSASRSVSSSLIELFQQHSSHLLASCFRYLDQFERLQAARCSHHLFDAACSPSSWACEDVSSSLHASGIDYIENATGEFQFRGPVIKYLMEDLHLIKTTRIFTHVRCVEVYWHDSSSLGELIHLNDLKSLEHLFITARSKPVSGGAPSISGIKLPANLKSFSFEFHNIKFFDARWILPILPPTLHTLQLLACRLHPFIDDAVEFDFEQVLQRLPQLQRLAILWRRDKENHDISIDTLGLSASNIDNLEFYCDICPAAALQEVTRSKEIPPHSPPAVLCATVNHLRLPSVAFLHDCSPTFDWATALPNLSSLVLLRMKLVVEGKDPFSDHLPVALGNRIKSLVIGGVERELHEDSPSTVYSHCFSSSGLTNLTSLTFNCHYNPYHGVLNELVNLTYLSCAVALMDEHGLDDFNEFANLRSLQTFKIDDWPAMYTDSDPHSQGLKWKDIDQAILNRKQSGAIIPPTDNHKAPAKPLCDIFPSLTELVVEPSSELVPVSCFEARNHLRTLPNLKSIKWEKSNRPVHPSEIDEYYSEEAIQKRHHIGFDNYVDQRAQSEKLQYGYYTVKDGNDSETDNDLNEDASDPCTMARSFDPHLLSKIFHFLRPLRTASASAVNKHWRSVTINPNLSHHPLRYKMDPSGGSMVQGPQLYIGDEYWMVRTLRSQVFRNVEMISLTGTSHARLPRESRFANHYLRNFVHLSRFTRLQVLSLNWAFEHNYLPSEADLEQIQEVFLSPALEGLRVFRMMAPAALIYSILPFLSHLQDLEAVELRYAQDTMGLSFDEQCDARSLKPLTHLPSLKKAFVLQDDVLDDASEELFNPSVELFQPLCGMKSSAFEELMWRGKIVESMLRQIGSDFMLDQLVRFPRFKSLFLDELNTSLDLVADVADAFSDLCEVSISRVLLGGMEEESLVRPLPVRLASQLRTLRLQLWVSAYPKSPRVAHFLQSLVDSNLRQLECFILLRNYNPSQLNDPAEDVICEQMQVILDGNPNLTELDIFSFDVKLSCWERVVPSLRIVHEHPAITALFELCQQIREYHTSSPLRPDILNDLLHFPHFEAVIQTGERNGAETRITRAQIAREQESWDATQVAVAASSRHAELQRLRTQPHLYYLRTILPAAPNRKFRSGGKGKPKRTPAPETESSNSNQGESNEDETLLLAQIINSFSD